MRELRPQQWLRLRLPLLPQLAVVLFRRSAGHSSFRTYSPHTTTLVLLTNLLSNV